MGADGNKPVIIDGLAVRIFPERMSDWHTFGIIRRMQGADNYTQLDAMFELIAHVSDQTEATIVEHLGGDTAKAEDVVGLAIKIVEAANPKNS